MSAAIGTGTRLPATPLRAELAAYFVPPARPRPPQGRDCRHGILRELAEQGLIR